eukprot:3472602-Prymnesium_polylepis.1
MYIRSPQRTKSVIASGWCHLSGWDMLPSTHSTRIEAGRGSRSHVHPSKWRRASLPLMIPTSTPPPAPARL